MLNFWGGALVASLSASALTFFAAVGTATGFGAHPHKPHWMATSILLFVTIGLLTFSIVAYLTGDHIDRLEHPQ